MLLSSTKLECFLIVVHATSGFRSVCLKSFPLRVLEEFALASSSLRCAGRHVEVEKYVDDMGHMVFINPGLILQGIFALPT
eukprot:5694653-Amphidinium_carterae.2